MESVLRSVLVYFVLFLIFRISGKRTLNEATPFGLILIFLISSSVAEVLKGEDKSSTNGIIQAFTLAIIHMGFAILKARNKRAAKIIDDVPTLIVKDGNKFEQRMKEARICEEDLLVAARQQKVTHISDIKYAIIEIDGSICIIPKEK
ncbi:MAG: hypothetical protein JWO32_2361 [Bacteroidetes bacterium]|nr:hypothetical protein [Bacteroidota bacterium]